MRYIRLVVRQPCLQESNRLLTVPNEETFYISM